MKRFEIALRIRDKDYIDSLVVALVRQGYDVYYNSDVGNNGAVCFTVEESEVEEIKRPG